MAQQGMKFDQGKTPMGKVLCDFSRSLTMVCRVGEFGANKYSWGNWVHVPEGVDRYTDAMLRHYFAESEGKYDPESGFHHAAHAAWCALARLDLMLREAEKAAADRSS